MRVCLQCDSEFVDDPVICRSCGAHTVTPQHAAAQHELRARIATEKLVAVHELEGPVDQAILGELLTQAGIPHAVHGGSTGGRLPGVDHGGGHAYGSLLVLEEHLEDARRIVRHYQASVVVDPDSSDEGTEDVDTES